MTTRDTDGRRSAWGALAARSALAISVSVIMLVALDVMVRVMWGPPATAFLTPPGRDIQTDYDVTYGVNPDRTRKTCPPSQSPLRTIAVIGDSFAFGLGVADGEDFAARLSCTLPRTAVVNLGAAKQDFLYYHLALRSMVPRATGTVILLLYENDLPPSTWGSAWADAKFALYRWSWTTVLAREAWHGVRESRLQSTLGSLTVDGRANNVKAVVELDPFFYDDLTNPPADRLAAFERALTEFVRHVPLVAPGATTLVAFAPEPVTLSAAHREFTRSLVDVPLPPPDRPSRLYTRTRDVCRRERGCSFVDLFPVLESAGAAAYFPHDSHWNSRGHELVAEAFLTALNQ